MRTLRQTVTTGVTAIIVVTASAVAQTLPTLNTIYTFGAHRAMGAIRKLLLRLVRAVCYDTTNGGGAGFRLPG